MPQEPLKIFERDCCFVFEHLQAIQHWMSHCYRVQFYTEKRDALHRGEPLRAPGELNRVTESRVLSNQWDGLGSAIQEPRHHANDLSGTTFNVPEVGFLQHCGGRFTMAEDLVSLMTHGDGWATPTLFLRPVEVTDVHRIWVSPSFILLTWQQSGTSKSEEAMQLHPKRLWCLNSAPGCHDSKGHEWLVYDPGEKEIALLLTVWPFSSAPYAFLERKELGQSMETLPEDTCCGRNKKFAEIHMNQVMKGMNNPQGNLLPTIAIEAPLSVYEGGRDCCLCCRSNDKEYERWMKCHFSETLHRLRRRVSKCNAGLFSHIEEIAVYSKKCLMFSYVVNLKEFLEVMLKFLWKSLTVMVLKPINLFELKFTSSIAQVWKWKYNAQVRS